MQVPEPSVKGHCNVHNFCGGKIKAKVAPVHAMKARRGNRGVALLIPNLGTGWR